MPLIAFRGRRQKADIWHLTELSIGGFGNQVELQHSANSQPHLLEYKICNMQRQTIKDKITVG